MSYPIFGAFIRYVFIKKQTDIKYFKAKNKPIATKHRLQSLLPYQPHHHPTLPYNVLLYP